MKTVKKSNWLLCPICGNKTRDRIREDTVLKNYPLYCPKCKQETLIEAKNFQIKVIKEPDALDAEPMKMWMQSQIHWLCFILSNACQIKKRKVWRVEFLCSKILRLCFWSLEDFCLRKCFYIIGNSLKKLILT